MTQHDLWQSSQLWLISFFWQVFDMLAFVTFVAAGSWVHVPQKNFQPALMTTKTSKNHSQTLQNRGPGAPKSSSELSKTQFLKDIQFKRIQRGSAFSFLRPKWPTWLQVGSPRGFKIEAQTRKNRCQKATHIQHRFFHGSDFVLGGFLVGILNRIWMRKRIWRKAPESHFVLEKPIRNRCRRFCNRGISKQISTKICMFFGASISDGFWIGFGKVLGHPNPKFSQFFRCFCGVNFAARFRWAKNAKNDPTWPNMSQLGPAPIGLGGIREARSLLRMEL